MGKRRQTATRPAAVHAAVTAMAPRPPTEAQQVQMLAIADSRRGQGLGFPQLIYNPDSLARRKGGLRVYDQMLTDEQVRACYEFKRAVIVGPGWQLTPQDDDDARQMALAALLTDDLERLRGPVDDVLVELLTAIAYGFAVSEKDWVVDDGSDPAVSTGRRAAKRPNLDDAATAIRDGLRGARLRLAAVRSIAPHGIEFVETPFGQVTAIEQQGNPNGALPPGKFVHFVPYGEFQNPYGTSEFRCIYTPWFHKQHWTQAAAIWGEKLADGPVIVKHPPTETPEKVTAARNTAANLQARTAMAVPTTYDVSILEGGRDPHATFIVMIEHLDREIAKGLLVPDKLGIGGGAVEGGSYSLAQTQLGAFLHVLGQLQRRLVACVQEQIVDQMAAFADPTIPPPRFGLLPLSEENRAEVIEAFTSLQGTQSWPVLLRDVNHIRELMGLRPLSDEEWKAFEAEKEARRQEIAAQAAPKRPGAPPDDDDEEEPDEAAELSLQAAAHRGLLVALWLEPEDAAALMLKTRNAEPAEDLHITLCYCPEPGSLPVALNAVLRAVESSGVLRGTIGGVGRFHASPSSDGKDVAYAAPDVPGLTALRERIAVALCDAGTEPSAAHGYTPHITLAYVEPGARLPVSSLPAIPLTLRRLVVKQGGETLLSVMLPDAPLQAAARVVPTAAQGGTPPAAFWRALTAPETRMDLAAVRTSIETDTATVGTALAEGAEAIVAAVRKAARKLLPDPDPTAVRMLSVSPGVTATLRKALQADLVRTYDAGRAQAKATLRRARQDAVVAASADTDPVLRVLAATKPGLIGAAAERFFRAKAFWITGLLESKILEAAQAILFNAIKGDKLPRHIEAELDAVLNPWLPERDAAGTLVNVPARLETIARTNVAEAQNEARYAVFTDPDLEGFVEALQYSAILDDRVRSTHAAWDGVVKPADYWLGPPDRRPPAGFNCRCTLVPIVATDAMDTTPDDELPTVQPFPDEGFR